MELRRSSTDGGGGGGGNDGAVMPNGRNRLSVTFLAAAVAKTVTSEPLNECEAQLESLMQRQQELHHQGGSSIDSGNFLDRY